MKDIAIIEMNNGENVIPVRDVTKKELKITTKFAHVNISGNLIESKDSDKSLGEFDSIPDGFHFSCPTNCNDLPIKKKIRHSKSCSEIGPSNSNVKFSTYLDKFKTSHSYDDSSVPKSGVFNSIIKLGSLLLPKNMKITKTKMEKPLNDQMTFYAECKRNKLKKSDLVLHENHYYNNFINIPCLKLDNIQIAIKKFQHLIIQYTAGTEHHTYLVNKIVQLRLRKAHLKSEMNEYEHQDVQSINGHLMKIKCKNRTIYCDSCVKHIWRMFDTLYECTACGFSCHKNCLVNIFRSCPRIEIGKNPTYIYKIFPEYSLRSQNYQCYECKKRIDYNSNSLPIQCDYSGKYFCYNCHWNDKAIIPARVLSGWDFTPKPVCRWSFSFLKFMSKKPIIDIRLVNPMLFSFVHSLGHIREMRIKILQMKRYLLECDSAISENILHLLDSRQHFVDDPYNYTMIDIIDTKYNILEPFLEGIFDKFIKHIKVDCLLCKGKGYVCEICSSEEIIYPFGDDVTSCEKCYSLYHTYCYDKTVEQCPRCMRRLSRKRRDDKLESKSKKSSKTKSSTSTITEL
ncbi:Differentially expressed in FDCP 8 [Intoshia linei]|uniref:Differentially expressed in FDCP 8 n=1 Tax=Intoshia linei TaxID=1819745 RepID=A0A177B3Z6_9BILA|nr:Differentially expressed in FDCP 8 [Intoshia linei]